MEVFTELYNIHAATEEAEDSLRKANLELSQYMAIVPIDSNSPFMYSGNASSSSLSLMDSWTSSFRP